MMKHLPFLFPIFGFDLFDRVIQFSNSRGKIHLSIHTWPRFIFTIKINENTPKKILEHVRASYRLSLPFSAVSAVSITPSFDFARSTPSCTLTGKSGTGRTAAVLDLNLSDPTLSVVHALDER